MNQAKCVIVTGASRGLGAAIARAAAEMGASVVLSARSDEKLSEVADAIRRAGGRVTVAVADVSRPEECTSLVEAAIEQFGRLDTIVNNAGVIEPIARLADSDPDAWARNWAVNVLGPVSLTAAALPHLRERSGRVINVSSGAAVSAMPGWGAYCASKAAINHLTAVLAREEPALAALAVRPGVVDTAMQATIRQSGSEGMAAEQHANFVAYHEQGQLLPPERPGRAIALLALYAPVEWSGTFIAWDDPRVESLARND